MREFRPHPWAAGGHRQTLLGYWSRRGLAWPLASEDVLVDAADDVRLLLRASWRPGPRETRPALLLVHGMGGVDASGYMLAAGAFAWHRGWHVVRMNMRGAGEGARVCARLYNAGLDVDLLAAVEAVLRRVRQVAVAGFSLGGNLALLLLGRLADRLPPGLLGAVAVSPPLDLAACADALERPSNGMYQWYFVKALREAYRERQCLRPDLYEARRERGTRTVRAFDAAVTAPYGGFTSVEDYYSRSSAGPHLASTRRPALVLAAEDDPMIPARAVARWTLGPLVQREVLPTGGHVGFVAPTAAPGGFWAAERALAFLDALRGAGTAAEPRHAESALPPAP